MSRFENGGEQFLLPGILEEAKGDGAGCLMMYFADDEKESFLKLFGAVSDDDLWTGEEGFGREDEPHTTVLYGFAPTVTPDSVLDKVTKPITATIKDVSIFESEDKEYDVLKFGLESPQLTKLNKECREEFEYENSYPDYHPHVTIAYVTKGVGQTYVNDKKLLASIDKEFILSEAVYSEAGNKNKTRKHIESN